MALPLTDDQPWWQRLLWVGLPLLAIAAVVFLVLNRQDDSASDVEIEGVEWQLAELQSNGALQPAVAGSGTTLLLDGTTASGSGGCNSFNGAYDLDGSSLTFSPFATTLAFCDDPPGTGDQESLYFALFADVDEYSVVNDQLVLTSDGATVLLFSTE